MPNPRPWPAQWQGSGRIKHKRPSVTSFALKSGETFRAGDFVGIDGTPEILALSGLDPTPIKGLAAEDAANVSRPGFVMVYDADDDTIFAIKGSRVPVTGDKGVSYGFLVDGDGIHTIDLSDISNTRFSVSAVDINRELYLVKVLTAHQG